MTLYLPPHVAEEKRREFAAEILKRVTIEDDRAREYTAKLQQIDPRLFMVKAYDLIAPGTPLRPGFYHVLRRNEGAPMSVFVVHDNEQYVEPDDRVFERLAAGNLTQQRVLTDLERQERVVEEAAARERERQKEARRDELKERTAAVTRAQISMDRSEPWSQNVAGRRGR